ncbi:unnamed protein product, partial [marine sediment metagenome]
GVIIVYMVTIQCADTLKKPIYIQVHSVNI